jgi:hypothetical protein
VIIQNVVVHDIPQRSPEWYAVRAGKLTASNFRIARETLKNGNPTSASNKLAAMVAIERICGYQVSDTFETWAMRRGTELEGEAISHYEIVTGNSVQPMGFVETDCGRLGCSPDGLIGDDGIIEVKAPIDPEKVVSLALGVNPAEYMDQVQGNLWILDRKWCDLIIYTPQLDGVGRGLNVSRIVRNDKWITGLEKDLKDFLRRVDAIISDLNTKAA